MTEVTRTALHRTDVSLRHYCRHPKCRSKLPEPVDIDRGAFCSRGCYVDFYRRHCLVCEADIDPKHHRGGPKSKFCGAKHQYEAARNPEAYAVPARFAESPETLPKTRSARRRAIAGSQEGAIASENPCGTATDELPERGRPPPAEGWRGPRVPAERAWAWESSAGEWLLVDGRGDTRARVARKGDRWAVIWPRAIPATGGKDLEVIKEAAVSLALAALPLDKATQARVRAAERELLTAAIGR